VVRLDGEGLRAQAEKTVWRNELLYNIV